MVTSFKNRSLFSIYLSGFLIALSVALTTYINSSFLNSFVTEKVVGIIYIISSIFTLVCFLVMPLILRKFGNYQTALVLISLELISLLGIVFFPILPCLIVSFVLNLTIIPLIYFSMDIFLEGLSSNRQTGFIRGVYLTLVNLAWVVSVGGGSLILANNDYWKIYAISFALLLPVALILVLNLKRFKDSEYEVTHICQTARLVWKNKNIYYIFMSVFLLQVFYAWMVIYMPIYLHTNIGLSLSEIGKIFGIMLLPFVLVEFLAGKLADSYFGEKEMLSIGFIIMAVVTGLIFFVTGKSLFVWSLVLFTTRIGAAMVEVMCDVYFFKKVDNQNADLISFYRMASPLAYVVSLFLATILLGLPDFGIRNLILVLGFIMLFGLRYSLAIEDTK